MLRLYSLVALLVMAISPSDAIFCLNGGQQQIGPTGAQICSCRNGFAGKECQYAATQWCSYSQMGTDAFCTNNGACRFTSLDGSHPGCNCVSGRVGDHCEFADDAEFQTVREALGIYSSTGGMSAINGSGASDSEGGLSGGAIAGVVIAVLVVTAIIAMSALLVHRMNLNHATGATGGEPDYTIEADGTTTFSEGPRMNVKSQSSIIQKMKGRASKSELNMAKDLPIGTLQALDDNDGVLSPTSASGKSHANLDYADDEDEITFDRQSAPSSGKSMIDTQGFPATDQYAKGSSAMV